MNEQLQTIVELPNVEMSDKIGEITKALSKAQGELEGAKKDTQGYGYNYSDLASVISTAKPILSKNGLAIVQLTGNDGDKPKVTTILSHSSGEFFRSCISMDLVEMNKVNNLQRAGATISYLRRYALQAILGMSSEDNDASSNVGDNSPKSAIKAAGISKSPSKGFGVK